mmetsp:Transcript_133377/g.332988  ORF Transcript_133377/g.332988 Transcript_133377/m.332988 type:complete len:335 (+) Transcript_133377:60-1064(+)
MARCTPALKSVVVAAWLTGALSLGRLAHEYISVGGPVRQPVTRVAPRAGAIAKGITPSPPFPSASEPHSDFSADAIFGALAAGFVMFLAATGMHAPDAEQIGALPGFGAQPSLQAAAPQQEFSNRKSAVVAQRVALLNEAAPKSLSTQDQEKTHAAVQATPRLVSGVTASPAETIQAVPDSLAARSKSLLMQSQRNVERAVADAAAGVAAAAAFSKVAMATKVNRPAVGKTRSRPSSWSLSPPRAQVFAVGDKVEAKDINGSWYPATISNKLPSGKFRLEWADGYPMDRLRAPADIRPLSSAKAPCRTAAADQQVVALRQLLLTTPVKTSMRSR